MLLPTNPVARRFIGGLCHHIWEVLQSQPLCCRQHSNEVINNLQQLLRERDLICSALATSDSGVAEQTAPKIMRGILWSMRHHFAINH